MTTKHKQAGFSAVEVLLAATVFGFTVTALVGALVYGRAATADAGDNTRAMQLADEGVQAVSNIGNAAFANLTTGTFGLAQSAGTWILSGASDTTGIYTRACVLANGSTVTRRTVTCTVTWGAAGSVSVVSQLTNWPAATKLWSNAVVAGGRDIAASTVDALKTSTAGNYAYTVMNAATNNFVVSDISVPATPTAVATLSLAGTPSNIFVSGNYAYVTTGTAASALQIISISNPAAPSVVKILSFTGAVGARGVYVVGNYAFVVRASDATAGANEFNVINNATVPASATIIGGYNNNIQMNEVYVAGNYAYVATSSTTAEMLVLSITTLTAPALAATYNPATALAANTITGYGNTILLGMSTTLDAINIITPTTPVRFGTFTSVGTINDIEVDTTNQFAFLGTTSTTGEFQSVSITNPAAMALSKTVDVTGAASTVNGVAYNTTYDTVIGATASDTQEVIVFTRN